MYQPHTQPRRRRKEIKDIDRKAGHDRLQEMYVEGSERKRDHCRHGISSSRAPSDPVRPLEILDDLSKDCFRQHWRHCISDLLQHSNSTEAMLQRKGLQAGSFSMGIPSGAAWVVVLTTIASHGLRKCRPAVIGVLRVLKDAPFNVVIWVSLWNTINCMVNGAERKES